MVSCDLNTPGKDYDDLIEALESYPNWWHCLDSTWIITTGHTAVRVCNHLGQFTDPNDKLLVAELTGAAVWKGFSERASTWLKDNL